MLFDPKELGNSPVDRVRFQAHNIYVKRDDLLGSQSGHINQQLQAFNGNKARKLHYYLCNDFPDTTRVISYGSAQSNMLYSLSVLCQIKGWQLDFYVDHIAKNLSDNPGGNYAQALANGADIHAIGPLAKEQAALTTEDYVQTYVLPKAEDALYIPEGGRHKESEFGLKILADELLDWVKHEKVGNPKLMLPSGTGTTAFYLQKHLPFEVLTCACVGDPDYLQQQLYGLDENSERYPTVLSLKASDNDTRKKYHFGKLYPEFFEIWYELQEQTGITFELLYDPLGWLSLLSYLQIEASHGANVIYLHQGGLLGNKTMLERYKRVNAG